MNIADAIRETRAELLGAGVPNAAMDAAVLVSHVVGREKTFLIAHPEHTLSEDQEELRGVLTQRRAAREPLQYIIGRQEFYGREFKVTPAVLIPRPETEILVERAVDFLRAFDAPTFCEIGIGSGCISISILCEIANATAAAVDISQAALNVAMENATRLGVRERITFTVSDVFSLVPDTNFDTIVSNPPYVPESDLASLQAEVRDFEPSIALTGGSKGLDVIERLVAGSPGRLRHGGALIFELGYDQSEAVRSLFNDRVWRDVKFITDLQGFPRIAFGVKR